MSNYAGGTMGVSALCEDLVALNPSSISTEG